MRHKVLATLAVAGALSMGVAACGSSSSGSGSKTTATGKTLVVESTPLSPMTDTFNPFSLTATGYLTNSTALVNEPLFIFNTLNSAQAPIPMLATGDSYSNGGKTLTLTIRSGVKWNDGKPFSAADVAFTFNAMKAEKAIDLNALWANDGGPLTSVTAKGSDQVVFTFNAPAQSYFYYVADQSPIIPQHIFGAM